MLKFSIVIPCWNAAATLAATLDSALAQSLKDFELLVINDGSTDDSAAIALDYSRRDPRVCLHNLPNGGVSRARNHGAALSKGEYIAFLDADDFWALDKLEKHAAHFDTDARLGVSFAQVHFLGPDGEPGGTYSKGPFADTAPESLLYENPTCTSSNIVVRRCAFEDTEGFNEAMSFAEDQEWLFRLVSRTSWKMAGIPHCLVGYRASRGGLSADLTRMEDGWEKMMAQVKRYAPDTVARHYPPAHAAYLRYLARRALRLRHPPRIGWNYLKRAAAADWTIFLREPRRSWLTALGLTAYQMFPRLFTRAAPKRQG